MLRITGAFRRVDFLCLCFLSVLLVLVSVGAVAQTSGTSASSADQSASSGGLEEIVVTAQRRQENLKDVPISVQVLSADQLVAAGVNSTTDLAAISPTINFQEGPSFSASSISLRGVSSVAQQAGIQPSTSLVINGVPVYRQGEFVAELADIDHIEVLNGPQGTLFGKNSTAGVINIVTKQPTDKFEASIDASTTTDHDSATHLMVNAPLTDDMKLRVVGYERDQKPICPNLDGHWNCGLRARGISGKMLFTISEDADLELAGGYSHRNGSWSQNYIISGNFLGPIQRNLVGTPFFFGNYTGNTNSADTDVTNSTNFTGTFNWRPSDHLTMTSISNWTHFTEDGATDVDDTPAGSSQGTPYVPSTYPIQSLFLGLPRIPDKYTYFSQEIRANYVNGPSNTVIGMYYQNTRNTYSTIVPLLLGGVLVGADPTQLYFTATRPTSTLNDATASLFGDSTLNLTHGLRLFGGVRFTNEQMDFVYHQDSWFFPYSSGGVNLLTGVISAAPSVFDTSANKSINNVSGRAGIGYEPTSDVDLYATWSRGYKAPAANSGSSLGPGQPPIINPEIATSYEIGAKLRLFDRLAFNIAGFYETIDGIQESVVPSGSTSLQNELVNAGKLKTRGVEADFDYAATSWLRFNGGADYDNATYADFTYSCNTAQTPGVAPCNVNLSKTATPSYFQNVDGYPAVGAPKYKLTLNGNYHHDLDNGMSYYGQLGYTYTGRIQFQLDDSPFTVQPGHGLLNGSLGLKGPNDHWTAEIFGRNLTNKFYYSEILSVAIIGNAFGNVPRDFKPYGGIRLSYNF